jgi:N-methylhydantoinase A
VDQNPLVGTREAYCFAEEEKTKFDVYNRDALKSQNEISGPAIVQEDTTTTIFHSDQEAVVDDYGHLIISGGEES